MGKGNIVLIGMMGSGKSTVLRSLSELYGMTGIDTDSAIVARAGMEISEIFEAYGEAHFRNIERETVEWAASHENAVISTGGGVVKSDDNVNALKSTGAIVYLRATDETLANRLINEAGGRPLLADHAGSMDTMRARIRELLDEREGMYTRSCDIIVDVDGKAPDAIAREIHDMAENLGQSKRI